MVSLDNLAKSIEKLADAVSKTHQSAKEKAEAEIFAKMNDGYLSNLRKMIDCINAAETEFSQYLKWRTAIEKHLSETSFPLPTPPRGSAITKGDKSSDGLLHTDNPNVKRLLDALACVMIRLANCDGVQSEAYSKALCEISRWDVLSGVARDPECFEWLEI